MNSSVGILIKTLFIDFFLFEFQGTSKPISFWKHGAPNLHTLSSSPVGADVPAVFPGAFGAWRRLLETTVVFQIRAGWVADCNHDYDSDCCRQKTERTLLANLAKRTFKRLGSREMAG